MWNLLIPANHKVKVKKTVVRERIGDQKKI